MLYALLALAGLLSLISARSSFYPLKLATSFAWFGALVYWIGADLVADTSPTDTVVMLTLLMLGLLFLFWGLAGRTGTRDVEVTRGSRGEITKLVEKLTTKKPQEKNTSLMYSNNLENRKTVRRAAKSGQNKRRR